MDLDSPRFDSHSPRENKSTGASLDGTSELRDGAIPKPWFVYGITAKTKNNSIAYHDGGKTLCYPVGAHVAFFSSSTGEISFFPGQDKVQSIIGMTLSQNKKYMACVEEIEEDPVRRVTVYSLLSMRPVRMLMDPETRVSPITGISFSESSKFLIVQHGEPDNTLVVWRWQSGKVLASISFDTPVHKALFNPNNPIAFATVCSGSASIHRVDADLSAVRTAQVATAPDASKEAFTSAAWLAGHLIAFTTTAGRIQVNHEGEVKVTVVAAEGDCLMSVVQRGRGMVAGGQSGTVYFFDATIESLDIHKKKGHAANPSQPAPEVPIFKLMRKATINTFGSSLSSALPLPSFLAANTSRSMDSSMSTRSSKMGMEPSYLSHVSKLQQSGNLRRSAVVDMTVGGGDDSIAIFTAGGEVLTVEISELVDREERKVDELLGDSDEPMNTQGPFRSLHGGFGTSRVVGMDAITFRPLMAVVTADRFARVTNYESRRGIAVTHLPEDPHCCSLHPSGTQLLVGMQDKLRLYGVALDELPLIGELPVKACNIVKFSHGGAFFAAVGRSNTIVVHHSYTLHLLGHLKGHVSAVTSISFSADDRTIVSSGAGGAVYFWDLNTFSRIPEEEHVDKTVIYCSAAVLPRLKGAVVRTHDGRLQHLEGGAVVYEVPCHKGGERAPIIMMGDDGNVVLAATTRGSVLSFPWPISIPIPAHAPPLPPPREYRLHAKTPGRDCGLSSIIALQSKGLLFTAASDGTVIVSKLTLVRRGAVIEHIDVSLNSQGVIPVQYTAVAEWRLLALKEKQDELLALVASTKTASDYQTLRATLALREQLQNVEEELSKVKSELKERNAEVEDLVANASEHERRLVSSLEVSHNAATDELERLYDRRIELEAERLKQALGDKDDLQFRMEEEMERLKTRHASKVKALESKIVTQAQKYESMLAEAKESLATAQKHAEEYAIQTEIDYDDDRERLEKRLADSSLESEEREGKLKAENHLLKRTNMRLKGEKAVELKRMERMAKDNEGLREGMIDLQDTIDKLNLEMKERDTAMADNFSTISVLRRRVQDLEQYKFVLGYRAEAFQAQLKPKVEEAKRLNRTLDEHDKELMSSAQSIVNLTRQTKENARQVTSLKNEIQGLKIANKHQKDKLKLFSFDLQTVMSSSAERPPNGGKSERQRALEALYKKYCLGEGAKTENQVEEELVKHLTFAEKRANILQTQLEHKDAASNAESIKSHHDNAQLLSELQASHQESKALHRQLDSALSELRDLKTANKLLQKRLKSLGSQAVESESSPESSLVRGGVSLAGPIPPSRPTSAIPVPNPTSSPRPASASAARRCSVGAASSVPRHKEDPAPLSSTLGSLMSLTAEMASVSTNNTLRKALYSQSVYPTLGEKDVIKEEEEEGEEIGEIVDKLLASHRIKKLPSSQRAIITKRPMSAAGAGFRGFSQPNAPQEGAVRRRPTSAAGMGFRAVANQQSRP